MFQSLRKGNPFFILYKGEKPRCDIGTVVKVSTSPTTFPNNVYMPNQEVTVDVKVKVGDSVMDFKQLPAPLEIADFTPLGNNVVVSGSKEAINSEIESFRLESVEAMDSMGYHRSVISGCDEMLKVINPEFANEKKREYEISELKSEMSDLKSMLSQLLNQNINPKKEK